MTDLKNILDHEEEINPEELMRYLQGNATESERFTIEKQMASSTFVDEAVEGLQSFNNPTELAEYVTLLNKQLRHQTIKKESRRSKRGLKEQQWVIIAILAILCLCVIGYFLIHFSAIK